MKAIRLNGWGMDLELEDIPQPEPGDDEVLIRVRAASVNPFDAAVQAGYMQSMARVPMTLGTDFSGDVVATGSRITHVEPGDAVYGLSPLGTGAFAEYTTVKAHEVTHKPQSLDYVSAAAVPLPATAAWKSLFELLEVKRGERLLIHGAAGAVGGTAVELARGEGVFVYGVDIPEKADHAYRLGIDHFISNLERFEDVVQGVDAVLDLVGGNVIERSYNVLGPGGRFVTALVAEPPADEAERRGIRSVGLAAWPNADILTSVAQRIDAGDIRVFVNRTFPLDEANAAMAYRLTNKSPGKVVLIVS